MGPTALAATQVPFEPAVVAACDRGTPVVVAQPESASAAAYRSIAHQVAAQLAAQQQQQGAAAGGPKIVVD
jgi:MinD-like ATPase involved in chromosome partitioning or flagellar assembly